MAYTFSTDQQSIIDSRKQNILVSAAAGSGKTSVLTERIVRLVADASDGDDKRIDIDRILVVTFTKAAAQEMRERIGARLNEMLDENPDDVHLQRQAQLIYNAQITTIDSFCLNIVKNHFHKINVDPAFSIVSDGEKKLMMEDTIADVIKRSYEAGDSDFYYLVDCYSMRESDETLESAILSLYTYAMSYPDPKGWLEKCRTKYDFNSPEEFADSFYIQKVVEQIKEESVSIKKDLEAGIEIAHDPTGPSFYIVNADSDKVNLEQFFEAAEGGDYAKICAASNLVTFNTLKTTKGADPDFIKPFKDIRSKYTGAFKNIKSKYLGSTIEDMYEDMASTKRSVGKMIDLVIDFMDSFSEAKRDRGVIDFADMEHMAIEILVDKFNEDGTYRISDVAKGLRDYYAEVMVDEYQDSNLVQEILIQSISRENSDAGRNRFMVGDVKQSIYRFRLARPDIFVEKTDRYKKDETSPDRLITLKQNYRSRDSVIDSVNAIFKDIMNRDRGGIEYDDDAKLTRAGTFTPDTEENKTEVILLDAQDMKSDEYMAAEMDVIASKIQKLVNTMPVYDRKLEGTRPAEYRDIAVLFRSPNSLRPTIKASFEKFGIPYHMEGIGEFYDTTEITDVISFLRIIDNPLDDISLYASMTSCFGHFTDEECANIKALNNGRNYYFWDKLKLYSEENPEDSKASAFISFVNRYRKYVTYMPISELIETLFEETGYRYIVAALPDGEQRLANVNLLSMKAGEYAKTSFHGLFHFMRYLELIKKAEQDEGEANIFDENANTVRVMTIHKSKGLEFPICIVGAAGKTFKKQTTGDPFIADIDYGIGASCIDPVKRTKRITIAKTVIVDHINKEELGEELRILYVALTRAKDKLIIIGSEKDTESWENGEKELGENSYLELIGPTIIKNKGSLFDLKIVDAMDSEIEKTVEETGKLLAREELMLKAAQADNDTYAKIKDRMSFVYPYGNLAKLYTKTSVSELKLAHLEEDTEAVHPFEENLPHETIPSFAGGGQETKGTARGTAYHNMLQHLNYAKFLETANLRTEYEAQKAAVISGGKMSEEDVSVIFTDKIISFLNSDLAKRMGVAERDGKLFKEQPFVIGIKASEVNEEFPDSETVLIQGVIDAFFIEDGEIVLLDYKTDRVETAEELVSRYKTQLDYYEEAAGRITGLKVKEKVIYSLRLNQSILLD